MANKLFNNSRLFAVCGIIAITRRITINTYKIATETTLNQFFVRACLFSVLQQSQMCDMNIALNVYNSKWLKMVRN